MVIGLLTRWRVDEGTFIGLLARWRVDEGTFIGLLAQLAGR